MAPTARDLVVLDRERAVLVLIFDLDVLELRSPFFPFDLVPEDSTTTIAAQASHGWQKELSRSIAPYSEYARCSEPPKPLYLGIL